MAGFVPVVHCARPDRPDEQDTVDTARAIAGSLSRQGYRAEVLDIGADLSGLAPLAARHPFAVFNLAETVAGDPLRAHEPAARMERLGLAHTGCRAAALKSTLSKCATKRAMTRALLPTARWWEHGSDVPAGVTVIVKSDSEHASLGIDGASIVPGHRAAAEIAAREARFGGRFFAEAFIEGREFNVALLDAPEGPRVLPIPEILFDLPEGAPRIVDYAAKWDSTAHAYHHTPRRFGLERAEAVLAARIGEIALGVWQHFALTGYARVDFRVGADGAPQVLEVNTNPCLAPDAGFAAAAEEAGLGYDALIAAVLAAVRVPAEV